MINPARPFGPIGHTYIAITCVARGFGGGGAGATLKAERIPFENYRAPKRDPWISFEDYHPPPADLITIALMAFGIFLGLAAFIALLLTITNGWTS